MNAKPKIMLIDDSKSDLMLMAGTIQSQLPGVEVTADDSLYSCFLRLTVEKPDVLVIDWCYKCDDSCRSIELINEDEVVQKILKFNHPVVIYTAHQKKYIHEKIVSKLGCMPDNFTVISKGSSRNLINFLQENIKEIYEPAM
jgi:CheY-like chemotaxis protein